MDEDTLIEVKVINKDDEENPTSQQVAMHMTLGQLRDWLLDNGVAPAA